MSIYLIAAILFFFNLLFFRKNVLVYELTTAIIHLVLFGLIKEFGVELILYLLFSTVPFLKRLRHIKPIRLFMLIYLLIELLIGLDRNFAGASADFFVMYYAVILSSIIENFYGYKIRNEELLKCIRIISVSEIVLMVLLYQTNITEGSFLTVNHQPVGGNLSMVGSFFVAMIMSDFKKSRRWRLIPHCILYVLISMIVDIRGYQIIIIPLSLFSLYVFLIDIIGRIKTIIAVLFSCVVIIAILVFQLLYAKIPTINTDIGYRTAENVYTIKAMLASNPIRMFFGYGIFAKGSIIGDSAMISDAAKNNIYYIRHLANDGRYLNFWLDILKDTGIVGLVLVLNAYFEKNRNLLQKPLQRKASLLFFLTYTLMLAFRNSCTCAMLELIMFKLVSQNYMGGAGNESINQ